jgi:hypothetical protein
MRKYADLHGDKRSFLGAVVGVVITSGVRDYTLRQGFFVVELSGETFTITPPNSKPKDGYKILSIAAKPHRIIDNKYLSYRRHIYFTFIFIYHCKKYFM